MKDVTTSNPDAQPTVYIETMGCQMNVLDNELVLGRLRASNLPQVPAANRPAVINARIASVNAVCIGTETATSAASDRVRKAASPTLVISSMR